MTGQIDYDINGVDVVVEYEACYTAPYISGPPENCYEGELDIELLFVYMPWGTVLKASTIAPAVAESMVDTIAERGEFVE